MLKGGATLLAATAISGLAPGTAHADVSRNAVGTGGYRIPTTRRTGYNGLIGTHTGQTYWTYDEGFYLICLNWIDTYHSILQYVTAGSVKAWFVGYITVLATDDSSSNHYRGNAVDITALYHLNGDFVDCNYSHRQEAGIRHNRRYAGLGWSARKHMPEVGIVGSDSSHSNHIHAGRFNPPPNGSSSLVLRRSPWDAWLMQYTCKVFMGVPIALDGDWGNQTEWYYTDLMNRLGLNPAAPFNNTRALQDLAHTLTARGLVGDGI